MRHFFHEVGLRQKRWTVLLSRTYNEVAGKRADHRPGRDYDSIAGNILTPTRPFPLLHIFKESNLCCFAITTSSNTFQNFTVHSAILAQSTVDITAVVALSVCSYAIFLVKNKFIKTLLFFLRSRDLCNLKLRDHDQRLFLDLNSMKLAPALARSYASCLCWGKWRAHLV